MSSSFERGRIFTAVAVVLLILLANAFASAQVEKRVVFAKGKNSASYTGKLPRNYADYDAYVFRAKRGQTLSIKLTTTDPNAYIAIYETQQQLGPDEDLISAGGEEFPRLWSGKLPVSSEFSVQIYGARSVGQTSNRTPYRLEITIQ